MTTHQCYLPASRVKAGSLRLGRLSVRTSDDHEIGKLLGFIVESGTHRIQSLVVEAPDAHVAVSMGPVQFDAASRALRLVESDAYAVRFSADSLPTMPEDDLWVPIFHSAA
jgi:hypothetical protein